MGLTKEKCIEALNYMHCPIFNVVVEEMSAETLKQLINEHFDNPPLKFEELEEGMWVWDTKFVNEYNLCEPTMIYITKVEMCRWGGSIMKYPTLQYRTALKPLFGTFDAIKFKDNRFYRREVHDGK